MNKPSLIAVEIGYLQGPAVHKLFEEAFPEALVEIGKRYQWQRPNDILRDL